MIFYSIFCKHILSLNDYIYLQNRNRRTIIKAKIGGYKMISKINGLTPIVKVTKNPKAPIAAATAGTLAVLSTHQVWPHPEPCYSHPKTADIPKIDLDSADSSIDLQDSAQEIDKLHGLPGIIENVADHISDGVDYVGDKFHSAWDNVKDFFEGLGH